MATFTVMNKILGPFIAIFGGIFQINAKPSAKPKSYSKLFFNGPEIPVSKRAERIKAWLAYEKRMQEEARNGPDEIQ